MRLGLALVLSVLIAIPLPPIIAQSKVATPIPDVIELPTPTGPFAVGRTLFDWVDAIRMESFTEDPADQRQLAVWVWYPAEATPEAQPAAYLPGAWGDPIGKTLGFDPNQVRVHAVADTALASEQERSPILVFSPGSGSFTAAYTALAEELASHGFVVVGVNHTYNVNVTAFADGRVVPALDAAQPMPPNIGDKVAAGNVVTAVHAADLRFVLDQLEQLDDTPGRFQHRLDLSRIGILGHSLGGAAAAEACRVDRRCDAGVNMDGTIWGEVARSGVPIPFLLLMSDHPTCADMASSGQITVAQCEAIEALFRAGWDAVYHAAKPGYWLMVEGSGHASYSDLPFLPLPPARDRGSIAGRCYRRPGADVAGNK